MSAAVLLATTFAHNAFAQDTQRGALAGGANAPQNNFDRSKNTAVAQRPHEGYEAKGLPLGGFTLYPKLVASVIHDDNIYVKPTNETDDVIWRVAPDLALVSDWSRHSLSAYARGSLNRYQDSKDENYDDYTVGADARIDVQRSSRITAGANYAHLTEPRSSPNSPTAAISPTEYDMTGAYLGGQKEFNRLRLTGQFDYKKFDYEDARKPGVGPASIIEQDDRDRTITSVLGRLDYAVSPDTALFMEISRNKREYDLSLPVVAISRDSDGGQALVGANFELGTLTRGEIAIGYIQQDFDSLALKDIEGFGARAQVEWFPTQLTTVTLSAVRSVEDSAVPGTGGYLSSNLNARIDHELVRNVLLSANAGYGIDKYEEIGREDRRISAGLNATYLVTRNVGLTVGYAYAERDVKKGTADPYKDNKLQAGVTLQF